MVITTTVLAATTIGVQRKLNVPSAFVRDEAWALAFAVLGVFPLYWIPNQNAAWLFGLKHLKTVPFTYAIGAYLSGFIVLLDWLD